MGALALRNFGFNDHLVRVSDRNGDAWFVANDVCAALELVNPRDALRGLEDDEKGVVTADTLGGRQKMTIISESGLYALIFKSRKAVAVQFRKWVTGEVLPSIRKTGGYGDSATLAALSKRIEEMQTAIQLLTMTQEQVFSRALAFHPNMMPLTHVDGRYRRAVYPRFWHDVEVRERAIELYGQTTGPRAVATLRAEFGDDRAPSKSALARFWLKLAPVVRSAAV